MSAPARTVRLLAFAEADAEIWGGAWSPAPGTAFAHLGGLAWPARIEGSATGEWSVRGEAGTLEVAGLGAAAMGSGGAMAQLCRVSGTGREGTPLEAVGCRVEVVLDADASVLQTSLGWAGQADGFALVASRPRKARGHDRDVIFAALFEGGAALPIADPRLSVTLRPDGSPVRAGLELWLTNGDDEPVDADETEDPRLQFPRRIAGESLGVSATALDSAVSGAVWRDDLMIWHLSGRTATGALGQVRAD